MTLPDLATRVCRIISRISADMFKRVGVIADVILGWSESVEILVSNRSYEQASRTKLLLAAEKISQPCSNLFREEVLISICKVQHRLENTTNTVAQSLICSKSSSDVMIGLGFI